MTVRMVLWQIVGGRIVMVEVIDRRPKKRRPRETVKSVYQTYLRATARHRAIEVPFEVVELGTRPIGSRAQFSRGAKPGTKSSRR